MRLEAWVSAALLVIPLCGCSDGPTIPEGAGALRVDVRLMGTHANSQTGDLLLFTSPQAFEDGAATLLLEMTGGPAKWEAETALAPGSYYFWACFDFGCGEYRTPAGDPFPVKVEEGRITDVQAAF